MKIYSQEKLDGLEKALASTKSLSHCFELKQYDKKKIVASTEQEKQVDLFYLDCILVSTVWNGNDEVFLKEEIVTAKKTPIHKQFNHMHDDGCIIGHITDAQLADFEGNIIAEDTSIENMPNELDIIVSSVLYKKLSDEKKQKIVSQLIEEIPEGKWFVSMECLFSDFDYAVVSPQGEQKIIARTEDSSFLTKHLRVYGGTGSVEGYKIGRVPKNLIFCGVGAVENPANKRSEIKSFSFVGAKASIDMLPEVRMSFTQEQYDALKSNYDSTKAELDTVKQSAAKANLDVIKSELDAAKAELTKATQDVTNEKALSEQKSEKIKSLETQIAELTEKNSAIVAELNQIKETQKAQARVTKLVEVGVESAKASEIVNKFSSVSEEMFAEVVELNKAAMKDKEEDDKETEGKSKCSTLDLDKVVAEKNTLPQGTGEEKSTASEWFTSILAKKK